MPCHTLETLTDDPHLKAVELINFKNHPTEGKTAVIRSTIQVDGKYPSSRSNAAPCGWDTNEILNELGYSETEMEQLLTEKAAYIYKDSNQL
jgi:crotonobetainyl-CoA:carnitine CoA-transferase CaiB-like acyl-CoA transferase